MEQYGIAAVSTGYDRRRDELHVDGAAPASSCLRSITSGYSHTI